MSSTDQNEKGYSLPQEGFVRIRDILKVLPVSRAQFYIMIQKGDAPAPRKLSERVSVWPVGEIREIIDRITNQETHNA